MMHDPNSPEGRMAKVIWEASRADEGSISATGADIVASALAREGFGQQRPLRRRLRIANECGQRWYRWSSWRVWDRQRKRYRFAGFRRWSEGFALGPVMVWTERRRG